MQSKKVEVVHPVTVDTTTLLAAWSQQNNRHKNCLARRHRPTRQPFTPSNPSTKPTVQTRRVGGGRTPCVKTICSYVQLARSNYENRQQPPPPLPPPTTRLLPRAVKGCFNPRVASVDSDFSRDFNSCNTPKFSTSFSVSFVKKK